jgi:hypothetical protein
MIALLFCVVGQYKHQRRAEKCPRQTNVCDGKHNQGAARMPIISAVDPIRALMGRQRDGNHEVAR